MNYLVVICNITCCVPSDLKSTDLEVVTHIEVAGNRVQRCRGQVQDWSVIVYSEPQQRDQHGNLVGYYLDTIINDILRHSQQPNVQVDQVRVYFHFSNIFPDHDAQCDCGAGTIHQTRYQDYEEKIRAATEAQGEIQVWGFHRTGGIWKVLEKLPGLLSGRGTLFANPGPRSLSEFIKELDKASHEEEVAFISIFKHRITHLFTPIDVDIQGLIESKFRPDYWEKVVAAYRETKPTRVITVARRIKEELGKVANNKQKKVIDKKWKEAEKEFENMKPLLTALGKGDLDNCIKQADGFRASSGKFRRILDELDDELGALDERNNNASTADLDR